MNQVTYIDIHGHVNFPEFDADREEVIARAQNAGVGMVNVGTKLASSKSAVELASQHENMWATIGMHPTDSKEGFDAAEFTKLATHPKVVAIGECGLDYFRATEEEIPRQREIFEQQIDLANTVGKPLMLHVRNGKKATTAYTDALAILKAQAKVGFNFHFFAGSMDDLKAILDVGGSVSFTGVLTFTGDYDEMVTYVPLDRIMSETDCPYVAPIPYRGKRNEPTYVVEVVKAIARIKGMNEVEVAAKLLENAKNSYGF